MRKVGLAALLAAGGIVVAIPSSSTAQYAQCPDGTSVADPAYCVYYPPPTPTPGPGPGGKVKPRVTINVKPKRDRSAPIRFSAKGKVKRASVAKRRRCRGTVTVRFVKGKKIVKRKTVPVKRSNCKYSAKRVKIKGSKLNRRGRLKVSAKFNGNSRLKKAKSKVVRVRYAK